VPALIDGKSLGYGLIQVHKNNTGVTGEVYVKTDLEHLRILDIEHDITTQPKF
jgi:hypothetical protein